MNARRDIGAEAVELAVFWENMCVPIIALPHLMAESYPVRSVLNKNIAQFLYCVATDQQTRLYPGILSPSFPSHG